MTTSAPNNPEDGFYILAELELTDYEDFGRNGGDPSLEFPPAYAGGGGLDWGPRFGGGLWMVLRVSPFPEYAVSCWASDQPFGPYTLRYTFEQDNIPIGPRALYENGHWLISTLNGFIYSTDETLTTWEEMNFDATLSLGPLLDTFELPRYNAASGLWWTIGLYSNGGAAGQWQVLYTLTSETLGGSWAYQETDLMDPSLSATGYKYIRRWGIANFSDLAHYGVGQITTQDDEMVYIEVSTWGTYTTSYPTRTEIYEGIIAYASSPLGPWTKVTLWLARQEFSSSGALTSYEQIENVFPDHPDDPDAYVTRTLKVIDGTWVLVYDNGAYQRYCWTAESPEGPWAPFSPVVEGTFNLFEVSYGDGKWVVIGDDDNDVVTAFVGTSLSTLSEVFFEAPPPIQMYGFSSYMGDGAWMPGGYQNDSEGFPEYYLAPPNNWNAYDPNGGGWGIALA